MAAILTLLFQNNSSVSMPLLFFLLFQNNRRRPGASVNRCGRHTLNLKKIWGGVCPQMGVVPATPNLESCHLLYFHGVTVFEG